MAISEMNYMGGGGSGTATTLWTNETPTANFPATTVNLSDNISNYDYLRITYRFSTATGTPGENQSSFLIPTDELVAMGDYNTDNQNKFAFGMRGGNFYGRLVTYVNDTSVQFSIANRLNGASQVQTYAIPTKVEGVKVTIE